MDLAEIGGLFVGLILTLFIFSFVLGDNPLYRFAVHLLVGVSAGFAAVVVIQDVLWPLVQSVIENPADPASIGLLIPLLFGLLLLLKLFPQTAWIGNSSMAVLMAIGAAVGLMGAIAGTLIPLVISPYYGDFEDELVGGFIGLLVAILTICTLLYFHFTGRLDDDNTVIMPIWQKYVSVAGQFVITITLAALFATTLSTGLVLLSNRVSYFIDGFGNLVSSLFS